MCCFLRVKNPAQLYLIILQGIRTASQKVTSLFHRERCWRLLQPGDCPKPLGSSSIVFAWSNLCSGDSWDKTGEGNVVLDYAISAQKYPKIVTQEKKKNSRNPQQWFLKLSRFFTEF
jgi:hypothetical protein